MIRLFSLICAFIVLTLRPAGAHGFGMRYDLPLPLDYFMIGGAAAVFLSFVMAAFFLRTQTAPGSYPVLNISRTGVGRLFTHPFFLTFVRTLAAGLFLLTVLAGYIGAPNPYKNISVVMVWVIAWVGVAFASALLGNIWALINPWNTLFRWAEKLGKITLDLPYPPWLGVWPGFIVLFVFAWLEINWSGSGIPRNVAVALTIYSLLTWTGMALFGRETWLRQGEAFAIVFSLFARFSVTEVRNGALYLRPPAVGLLSDTPADISTMAFVLLILASVTYDGFTETELFQIAALGLFNQLQGLGSIAVPIVSTIGLAGFPLIFLIAYLAAAALIRWAGCFRGRLSTVAGVFVFSLVPIAIAYHLAHYLSLLVFEGQNIIALISDPFGYGWNLFGTAARRVDLTVMDAEFLWFFSVAAIVAGHIAAVYLAHAEAMRLFPSRRLALLSQVPMLVLMVGYTMVSLWIVAQPIVG